MLDYPVTTGSFNGPNNRDRVSIISQFFGCWESKLAYRADQGHQASKTGNSKAYLVVLWFVRWQMKLQAFKLLFVVLLTFSHDYGVEGWRRRRRRRWTPPPPRQCTVSGRKSASFSFTKTVLILFVLEMQFSKFVRVWYYAQELELVSWPMEGSWSKFKSYASVDRTPHCIETHASFRALRFLW